MILDHQTLRIGDVYRGPRGGTREIAEFPDLRSRESEAWARHEDVAPFPEAYRVIYVLLGEKKRGRWMHYGHFEQWFAAAERITEGEGQAWPYIDCRSCHGVGLVAVDGSDYACETCPACAGKSWQA